MRLGGDRRRGAGLARACGSCRARAERRARAARGAPRRSSRAPACPRTYPWSPPPARAGTRVVGELEIGWRLLPNAFVAVTGSNGKTTTVELVGHIHREAGVPVAVAGNVGTPVTALPGAIGGSAVVVCEASSFQLEDTEAFAPDAAVLLNLAEDHLDRHGTFDAYRAAKLEAFARQPPGALAVAPSDLVRQLGGEAERVTFGPGGDVEDRDGALWWRDQRLARRARDPPPRRPQPRERDGRRRRLPGARAADRGRPDRAGELRRRRPPDGGGRAPRRGAVRQRLQGDQRRLRRRRARLVPAGHRARDPRRSRQGQRLPPVGTRGGGERPRRVPDRRGRGRDPRRARGDGVDELVDAGDLATAVAAARAAARPGDVVLLSPACASYDQYRSFEERGDHFRALVARGIVQGRLAAAARPSQGSGARRRRRV